MTQLTCNAVSTYLNCMRILILFTCWGKGDVVRYCACEILIANTSDGLYVTDNYQNEDTHATCILNYFLDQQLRLDVVRKETRVEYHRLIKRMFWIFVLPLKDSCWVLSIKHATNKYHRHSNSGPPFFLIWSLPRLWHGSLSGSISLNHLSIFYNISCYNSL